MTHIPMPEGPRIVQQGWQCPVCSAVMAPFMPVCTRCSGGGSPVPQPSASSSPCREDAGTTERGHSEGPALDLPSVPERSWQRPAGTVAGPPWPGPSDLSEVRRHREAEERTL